MYVCMYTLKSSPILMTLFTNTLLCLSLARLIGEPKVGLELDLFDKRTNINPFFSS